MNWFYNFETEREILFKEVIRKYMKMSMNIYNNKIVGLRCIAIVLNLSEHTYKESCSN